MASPAVSIPGSQARECGGAELDEVHKLLIVRCTGPAEEIN